MKLYNVGILGATGAVGQEMMKILLERKFPVGELRPIASARSAGSEIDFGGRKCTIVEASDDAFEGLDIVLGAAENDIAERFAPAIVKAGAVFVDNSSAFRLDPKVPLVIPEINPEDVKWHSGIISNPNCTTIVTLVAINALAKESPIETIIASSYQAVSGAGKNGIDELHDEVAALAAGKPVEPKVFQYQIAYNVIPQIGGEAYMGYTSEEMKMQNEGRKILHLPEMKVSCTCVRVPVVRSHSVSVVLRTKEKISVERARELIAAAPTVLPLRLRTGYVTAQVQPLEGALLLFLPVGDDDACTSALSRAAQAVSAPLTTLLSASGTIFPLLADVEDPVLQRNLAVLSRSCYQLLRASENLGDLSAALRGRLPLSMEKTDLTDFLDDFSQTAGDLCLQAGRELDVALPQAPIYLWADRRQLRRVLLALLSLSLIHI